MTKATAWSVKKETVSIVLELDSAPAFDLMIDFQNDQIDFKST